VSDENQNEKTEDPTSKKLEDALKKGDVVKSIEINNWFVMVGGALAIAMMGSSMAGDLMGSLKVFLAAPEAISMDRNNLRMVWFDVGGMMLKALLVPLGILIIAAIAGNVLQHSPVFTGERMKPKLSKISPIKGFERLFGPQSLMNLAKGVIKLTVVGAVAFMVAWPERDRLALMMTWEVAQLLPLVKALSLKMFGAVIAVMTIVAGLDYLFERFRWMKRQRMSVQEVKDEYKQMEGDPTVKAKLRQVRIERGRRRMMAQVPKATVVITNPTHYAVALLYEKGMGAPVCVAKGVDSVAFKIRELAEASGVPIVENVLLARALHATVNLDEEIKPDHYKAVAEVIGYVMRLRSKLAGRGRAR